METFNKMKSVSLDTNNNLEKDFLHLDILEKL